MTTLFRAILLATLAVPLSCAGGHGAEVTAAAVALMPSPALGKTMDAFPRVAGGPGNPAASRINRGLAALDKRFLAFGAECGKEAAAGQGPHEPADTTRNVAVTLQGTRYLSVVATDSWYCGGPYPDSDTVALVYDLNSGRPVDWLKLLPASLGAKAASDSVGDGTIVGMVGSRALIDLYLKYVDKGGDAAYSESGDCTSLWTDQDISFPDPGHSFQLWPVAKEGGIAIQPAGLPHVEAACAEIAVIPTAALRALGADPALLADIDAAHARASRK